MSDTTGEVLVFIYADKIGVVNSGTMPDNLVMKSPQVLAPLVAFANRLNAFLAKN